MRQIAKIYNKIIIIIILNKLKFYNLSIDDFKKNEADIMIALETNIVICNLRIFAANVAIVILITMYMSVALSAFML